MKIETQRLIIRPFTPLDIHDFFTIMSNETMNTYLPWYPITTIEQAQKKLKSDYLEAAGIHLAIELKETNRVIGFLNVSASSSHDFGYGILPQYWRKGLVKEACLALIDALKQTDLAFLTATHDRNNQHSGYVMKQIGMTYHYSYVEQWQPKNIEVTFRLYQLDLKPNQPIYIEYKKMYPEHFIEVIL